MEEICSQCDERRSHTQRSEGNRDPMDRWTPLTFSYDLI